MSLLFACLFIHKFFYRNQDHTDTFQNFFTFSLDVHSYRTRHINNHNLYLPFTRTSHHQFARLIEAVYFAMDYLPRYDPYLLTHSLTSRFKKHLILSWILESLHLVTSCPLRFLTSLFCAFSPCYILFVCFLIDNDYFLLYFHCLPLEYDYYILCVHFLFFFSISFFI